MVVFMLLLIFVSSTPYKPGAVIWTTDLITKTDAFQRRVVRMGYRCEFKCPSDRLYDDVRKYLGTWQLAAIVLVSHCPCSKLCLRNYVPDTVSLICLLVIIVWILLFCGICLTRCISLSDVSWVFSPCHWLRLSGNEEIFTYMLLTNSSAHERMITDTQPSP